MSRVCCTASPTESDDPVKLLWLLPILFLEACMPRLRVDVTCIAAPQGQTIIMHCSDSETWKEWRESQKSRI